MPGLVFCEFCARLLNPHATPALTPFPPTMFDHVPHQQFFIQQEQHKIPSGNLYLCQPHTVIELVEVAPPPPRRITSVISYSSAASSSYPSSSSSCDEDYDSEMEEEEEEESDCSSYCSSAEENDATASARPDVSPSSLSTTMKRILHWREHFDASLPPSDAPSLKRKFEEMDEFLIDNEDNISHSSKRSRSQASAHSTSSQRSIELEMHSCPACDAFFPTRQSLRQHGRDAQANEACWVAVEYAFEE